MRKKALQVTLEVHEPSVVELTTGDKVQLDRLMPSHDRYVAERHGGLLGPGTATLALEPGFYSFKTLSGANLRVVRGGVDTSVGKNDKDESPEPKPRESPPPEPGARGDELPGETPSFTVA